VPTDQTFCTASSEELDPGGNGEPPQRVSGLLAPIYHWFKDTGDAPIRLFAVVSGPKLRVVAMRPEKSKGTLRFRAGGLIFSGGATQHSAAFYWVKK
jgi:hypothetical protein